MKLPDERGYFGKFGGRFSPEILIPALEELEKAFRAAEASPAFWEELEDLLEHYAGRPTPLYFAKGLSKELGGARIAIKREDLLHTGAHKINNTLGQGLLARMMGKKRIIAETGAGQHGVAVATVCALFGFKCVVYMGSEDISRQGLNVSRMKLLGAEVRSVDFGSRTLKEAVSEAIRDWVTNVRDTYYLLGSSVGPHPYPFMVREFQSVIGKEVRKQVLKQFGRLPDYLIACVGGGSNAIGLFHPFFEDKEVEFIGVEAGGRKSSGKGAASLCQGRIGVLHGAKTYLLQDKYGQVEDTYSIAPGLDYPGVGPEHSHYKETGRAVYVPITDEEALEGVKLLSTTEGIIPALEPAHAIAFAKNFVPSLHQDKLVVINLSGRGDKDIDVIARELRL